MLDQRDGPTFYVEDGGERLRVRLFYPRRGKMMGLVSVDRTAEKTKGKSKQEAVRSVLGTADSLLRKWLPAPMGGELWGG